MDEHLEELLRGRAPRRRRGRTEYICTICERTVPYAFSCACGFTLCPDHFDDLAWGLTCNWVTWECPECGGMRSF
jgi:hypothetical protein